MHISRWAFLTLFLQNQIESLNAPISSSKTRNKIVQQTERHGPVRMLKTMRTRILECISPPNLIPTPKTSLLPRFSDPPIDFICCTDVGCDLKFISYRVCVCVHPSELENSVRSLVFEGKDRMLFSQARRVCPVYKYRTRSFSPHFGSDLSLISYSQHSQ